MFKHGQVFIDSLTKGSTIVNWNVLASALQPNATTTAVASLKQKAATGELAAAYPTASRGITIGGATTAVAPAPTLVPVPSQKRTRHMRMAHTEIKIITSGHHDHCL
mmetsp:Transcript_34172/g.73724  ORF Transcript_34172/g.73724 Transcript_34172/m.73724 type:complete len:107 (+) Transcript_34172:469-789(+)